MAGSDLAGGAGSQPHPGLDNEMPPKSSSHDGTQMEVNDIPQFHNREQNYWELFPKCARYVWIKNLRKGNSRFQVRIDGENMHIDTNAMTCLDESTTEGFLRMRLVRIKCSYWEHPIIGSVGWFDGMTELDQMVVDKMFDDLVCHELICQTFFNNCTPHGWDSMSEDTNLQAINAWREGKGEVLVTHEWKSPFTFKTRSDKYLLDFRHLMQQNVKTGRVRPIRLVGIAIVRSPGDEDEK